MIQSNGILTLRSENITEFPDEEKYEVGEAGIKPSPLM